MAEMIPLVHRESSEKIIGAAMRVLNELRPGLDEKLCENALVLELGAQGYQVEQQREFPVFYREQLIGKLVPDLIVENKVIVDPKVVDCFHERHIAQMLGYLAITGLGPSTELQVIASRVEKNRAVNE